jgi:hypothetical protein
MADITMCRNNKCKLKDNCYRYIAVPDKYMQSYLMNPRIECENKNYELFVEAKTK